MLSSGSLNPMQMGMIDTNDQLIGIDKGQAFKFFDFGGVESKEVIKAKTEYQKVVKRLGPAASPDHPDVVRSSANVKRAQFYSRTADLMGSHPSPLTSMRIAAAIAHGRPE